MTDAPGRQPEPSEPKAAAAGGADLGRRRFFRAFAAEIVGAAAQVVGVASALQQSSAEAAGALLDPDGAAARLGGAAGQASQGPQAAFRTAFRWEGERVIVIDHRQLPEAVVEVEARTAAEVGQLIRERAVSGSPLLGQLAAVALALTAERVKASQVFARRATLRGSGTALMNAAPSAMAVRVAVGRMLDRLVAVGELEADGAVVAAALREEAEAIIAEATAAHGRIAELGAEELWRLSAARPGVGEPEAIGAGQRAVAAEVPVPPLRILTLGATGAIGGGQFGTALSAITTVAHGGLPVHVTVAETRPLLQGSRLTAWELARMGLPHTVIADAAVGGILDRGLVDVVLVGADRIAANGDVLAVVGTFPAAVLATRHGVPVIVCAPLATIDRGSADGRDLPVEEGPMADVQSVRDRPVAPPESPAANPLVDVTPAELVSAIVTEAGVIRPPFDAAFDAALAAISRSADGTANGTQAAGSGS